MYIISAMQNFTAWMRHLPKSRIILTDLSNLLYHKAYLPVSIASIHTSSPLDAFMNYTEPKKWLKHNEKIYPPQAPEEERRPAVSKAVI
jgi:hypothetical protein